ncbi:hypothetical protein [Serratia proteamaculans]|uniref:Polyurethanase n=1 Tax=Serratia proteamaculans TaxID=28151 RepID=A0A5Q2V947_SERPR|nr:hypothetical protein [Serratia proteamaculans]QGH62032.1 hypothetical protein GHV41_14895 [Serratia proteamaculans]
MLFNYRDYDVETSADLIMNAWGLAIYAYHGRGGWTGSVYQEGGITPESAMLMKSTDTTENRKMKQEIDQRVHEQGWRNITPETLGYEGKIDKNGTFHGESGIYKAAEMEVMGKYDSENNLIGMALSFRGTSGPLEDEPLDTLLDRIAYLNFLYPDVLAEQRGNYVENAFGELIETIKEFAINNNLAAKDILVTGHSLGGGAVNNMAEISDYAWDGFFSDANYIAFASMYMKGDNSDKIINIGFDNDPVYKFIADGRLDFSAFSHNNIGKNSSVNNLHLFSDIDTLPIPEASLGFLKSINWLVGHAVHNYGHALSNILSSPLYEQMNRGSAVTLSYLSEKTRASEWVTQQGGDVSQSLGHFIIGSENNDLLRATGNTRVDGRGGNDIFQATQGNNSLYGSGGEDIFDTDLGVSELNMAIDGDTFYTLSENGGITIGHNIHWLGVKTEGETGEINMKVSTQTSSATLDELLGQKLESVAGDVQAMQSESWLFACDDDHVLAGSSGRDLFVIKGGEHKFFSEGGEDVFIFDTSSGNQTIIDFNNKSQLIFHGVSGMTQDELEGITHVKGNNTVIDLGAYSVTLQNCTQLDLQQLYFI